MKKITDTYTKMLEFYSPKGKRPNKQKFDLVKKAHEVLTDPAAEPLQGGAHSSSSVPARRT